MAMVQLVASGQVQAQSSAAKMLDDSLKSLGFRVNPALAPSRGVQLDASDYLSFGGSFLAGVAVGAVSVYEMAKIARDIAR